MKTTYKVKAIHYDPISRSVFLFKSDKSRLDGLWTTPGGTFSQGDPRDALGNLIFQEIGAEARIDYKPFYDLTYKNSRSGHEVNLRAYGALINLKTLGKDIEFMWASGTWIQMNRFKLTNNTRMITRSNAYDRYVEKVGRGIAA